MIDDVVTTWIKAVIAGSLVVLVVFAIVNDHIIRANQMVECQDSGRPEWECRALIQGVRGLRW